ncbi:unnamed protein product, partial [Amoebophrya sp. A25]
QSKVDKAEVNIHENTTDEQNANQELWAEALFNPMSGYWECAFQYLGRESTFVLWPTLTGYSMRNLASKDVFLAHDKMRQLEEEEEARSAAGGELVAAVPSSSSSEDKKKSSSTTTSAKDILQSAEEIAAKANEEKRGSSSTTTLALRRPPGSPFFLPRNLRSLLQ